MPTIRVEQAFSLRGQDARSTVGKLALSETSHLQMHQQ
jgi:hypothetical protein